MYNRYFLIRVLLKNSLTAAQQSARPNDTTPYPARSHVSSSRPPPHYCDKLLGDTGNHTRVLTSSYYINVTARGAYPNMNMCIWPVGAYLDGQRDLVSGSSMEITEGTVWPTYRGQKYTF